MPAAADRVLPISRQQAILPQSLQKERFCRKQYCDYAAADEVDGTEITFWHSMGGVNGQAIDELVNRFNEENELGITVVSEYQGNMMTP